MKNTFCFLTLILVVLTVRSSQAQTSNHEPFDTLEINRKKIDSLDSKIIETIGLREKLVRDIGIYKAKNYIPPLQASRFQEVLKNAVIAGKRQELSEEFVTELMNAIHKESLRIENSVKNKNN
jgi:chorismate mutase